MIHESHLRLGRAWSTVAWRALACTVVRPPWPSCWVFPFSGKLAGGPPRDRDRMRVGAAFSMAYRCGPNSSLADPTLIQGSFRFAYQIQSAFPQIATNGIQPMSTEFACFQNSTYTLHWMVSSRPMSETRYEFEVVSAAGVAQNGREQIRSDGRLIRRAADSWDHEP